MNMVLILLCMPSNIKKGMYKLSFKKNECVWKIICIRVLHTNRAVRPNFQHESKVLTWFVQSSVSKLYVGITYPK